MEEYFDIYDEHWQQVGTARRSEVHAKGYRHKAFHCWVTRRENNRHYVWFQLRQDSKDTFPAYFDITAAGHLSAGESVQDAIREIQEELGIVASFEELIPLGVNEEESVGTVRGVAFIDHERSYEYALPVQRPLSSLTLQQTEVAGVYEAQLDDLLGLFEDRISELVVQGVEVDNNGELQISAQTVTTSKFVPRGPGFYVNLFRTLKQLT